ncbi:hypothetical protein Sru01_03230 [Sphaerisporangium rufum]|uniref:WXG100 family type VII secretion target n=1 Tax=Sphaerisporangium rufum TaxID=1381558 RepID=A0A919UVS2_9ACTN|nr:hypothetical protein [Sphaerisporangium rufum]GII75341.1 hypothetical protein Sru01_03230 [Sphaerisporangium rufum]
MRVLDVTPDALRLLAGRFDMFAGDVGAAVGAAEQRLAAIGPFWGNSPAGQAFHRGDGQGPGYDRIQDELPRDLRALAAAYTGIRHRLARIADDIEVTDWASMARLPEPPR